MIVDVHTHLSTLAEWGPAFTQRVTSDPTRPNLDLDVSPERHWEGMAAVDRAIVFGINASPLQMLTPNDGIAAYARAHPDKIIGFASVDPNQPDAMEELERCVGDLGLCGLKMSPVYQQYHPCDPKARRIHRRAEELGLPILTHAAFLSLPQTPMEWANPLLYDNVAREFPGLKIVLAHCGLPWATDAMVVVRKHPNVYADISGFPIHPTWSAQALAMFHEFGLTDKLLLGSDFPICTAAKTIDFLRGVNSILRPMGYPEVPEDEIEAIIHRDTPRLLGL